MFGVEEELGEVGSRVTLHKETKVYQKVRLESMNVFLARGLPPGSKVQIGDSEEVASFFLDEERQPFVPWKDSGERDTQYIRVADLPPIVRLALSPVLDH